MGTLFRALVRLIEEAATQERDARWRPITVYLIPAVFGERLMSSRKSTCYRSIHTNCRGCPAWSGD